MQASRRSFIKNTSLASSAFVLALHLPTKSRAAEGSSSENLKPNAYIKLDKDNTITFIMSQAEMGQGAYTITAMCIAEELHVNWKEIKFEAAKVDPVYFHAWGPLMLTGGSSTVSTKNTIFRQTGAALNIMLKKAAAARWKIRANNILVKEAKLINKKTKEEFTFGELVGDLSSIPVPKNPKIKPLSQSTILGQPVKRLPEEAWAKVKGEAVFGIDVRVPDMKYAAILHPAIFGAKLKNFDASKALKREGVLKVKEIPSGIALIATHWWLAKEALKDISVTWDEGAFKSVSADSLDKEYTTLSKQDGNVIKQDGNIAQAFKQADKIIEAEYNFPFLAHAPMEPLNCVVHHTKESAQMWTGGQIQSAYRDVCASILGVKPENVDYNNQYLGGGFGRRATANADYIKDAAYTAKDEAWPVMTLWAREDDITMGNYRPKYKNRTKLALDKEGKITGFEATIVGQNIVKGTPFAGLQRNGVDWAQYDGFLDNPYTIASNNLQAHSPESPVSVLWWRSVGQTQSAPTRESLIELAAHESGTCPILYRINMLSSKRHINLLKDVAKLANWTQRKREKNVGYGVSFVPAFGSLVAQIAKVRVSGNDYKVEKVWCSVDCGFAFNPLNVKNQMISGINFGLAAAKYGEISLKDGAAVQSNFHDYQVARFSDVADIEVSILNSDEAVGGIGEPGTPPIFAAISNALFDATGKRYTNFPIKHV